MRANKYVAVTLAALMLGTASASGAVNVTFVNPEHYRDADFRSASKRQGVITDLTRYLERLDKRYLKDGQKLDIEVLDARLAGSYEPWQRKFHDVRILRDTTPPRFKVRYTLKQGGKVLISGEETLTDMNYLGSPTARSSSERFAYEKDMLRDWFHKRFVQLKAPRA